MTKGEKWQKLFNDKGWIKNNVISAGENEAIKIFINFGDVSMEGKNRFIDSAMILDDMNILCYDGPAGTAFFQWDDIVQVLVEEAGRKKKRLW